MEYYSAIKKNAAAAAKLLQSCPTLCDPIDGSPPGSHIPGILQARTLECMKQCHLQQHGLDLEMIMLCEVNMTEKDR